MGMKYRKIQGPTQDKQKVEELELMINCSYVQQQQQQQYKYVD